MRLSIPLLSFLLSSTTIFAQNTIEKTLERFNSGSVDYIHVDDLVEHPEFLLLDTRTQEEFEVSHLKNAYWVGYKEFQLEAVLSQLPDKEAPIAVYCSVGVRSEDIGEKLLKAGYTHVKNLYGGIFEWKNQGKPIYDSQGNSTEKVHAFNKQWGKLLTNAQKVYSTKSKPLETTHK